MPRQKQVASYGAWKSPITSDLIVSGSIGLGEITLDGADVYWAESRPLENGRSVIVRRTPNGEVSDVTPPPFNVRTSVHEYGGGAYSVADGTVYFSNFDDQRVYRQRPGEKPPEPITPERKLRYADSVVDLLRGRLICVREDHTIVGQEAVSTVVGVDIESGGAGEILSSGADFYSTPRLSPDGRLLAWLQWDHPNMPWQGTELWKAQISDDGTLGRRELVAGGREESVFQPMWSPDGVLYFVSDRTGWWNLYRESQDGVEPIHEMEAEFGMPQWEFGLSTYGFASEGYVICAYRRKGVWYFAELNTETGQLMTLPTPCNTLTRAGIRVAPDRAVFGAGSSSQSTAVLQHDLATGRTDVLRQSASVDIEDAYISLPEAIEFPTEDNLTAHGFYYPPKSPDFDAPPDEKPPLLVISHGGPTGSTNSSLSLQVQYWTSRGVGVLDVNYGGSAGYGTAYRRRLNGRWGIVDTDDCANGALYLVQRGDVDGDRMAIRGGSAGGYTTLCALTFKDVFKAGASYYGVSDLEALAKETHKFESRYLDTLIGPYPEELDLYIQRSPIHHTDRLSCPVVLFQGLEDKVVPPNQAEKMLEALRAKGIPVAYVPFEGEQHGFRRAENIKRSLDGELYFYSRVFGFKPAEDLEPVPVENLD